jgi:hypothetical protein
VIGTLKAAYVQGRLTKDELDLRVGQARPRERYRELMADEAQIQRVLAAGAERGRPEAAELLARVRRAIGREPLNL